VKRRGDDANPAPQGYRILPADVLFWTGEQIADWYLEQQTDNQIHDGKSKRT